MPLAPDPAEVPLGAFERPLVLLIALPALGAVAALYAMARRRGGAPSRAALALRCAASILVVAALAGPRLPARARLAAICVLADVSLSAGDVDRVERVVKETAGLLPPEAAVWVSSFAGGTRNVSTAGRGPFALTPGVAGIDRTESRIGRALDAAGALLPPGAARVVILVTDGRENAPAGESAMAAAGHLASEGVRVLALPLPESPGGDFYVQDIDLPPRVSRGSEFTVSVTVAGSAPGTAEVSLRRLLTGEVVSRREIDLRWNESARVAFREKADTLGFAPYYAEVLSEGDPVAANNSASAGTYFEGPSEILVVRPPGEAALSAAELLRAHFGAAAAVRDVPAAKWEPSGEELATAGVLVLENSGAGMLPETTQRRLVSFVRERGGGIVFLGGPCAYGAGGLTEESPLAAIIPVGLEPPQSRRVHAVFCLDSSGSMGRAGGSGRSKFDCARDAVAWAAEALGDADSVSVVTFAAAASAPVTALSGAKKGELSRRLAPIAPGGGTDLLAGIELAESLLSSVEADRRHILLLSDGEPTLGPADAAERSVAAAAKVRSSGGTLSVVGTSPDERHRRLLERIAEAGGGRLYIESRPELLREHFRADIRDEKSEYVRTGEVRPVGAAAHPVTAGLGGIPALAARNRVSAAASATTLWRAPGEGTVEPVLAVAARGMGRTAAFMGSLEPGWAGELSRWPERASLLGRLAEWVRADPGEFSVAAESKRTRRGRELVVSVHDSSGRTVDGRSLTAVLERDGWTAPVELELAQTGLGRYSAEMPAGASSADAEAGAVRVTAVEKGGAADRAVGRAVLKRLPPDELTRLGTDRVLLESVARRTGGRVVESPAQAAAEVARIAMAEASASGRPLDGVLAAAALALFLVELAVRAARPRRAAAVE